MHGAGRYWEEIEKAYLEKEHFVVMVFRLYDYYYETMSDSYHPDSMALDEYKIEVYEWREDRYGRKVADELSNIITTGTIDRQTAREIYGMLKHSNMTFRECAKRIIQ